MGTRRFLGWCCAVAFALAVAAAGAMAHVVVYETVMTGPSEFPPNTSTGTGTATVTIDKDLLTMHIQANFTGLQGNTTAAHIHGPIPDPPANPVAGVATQTPSFANFPLNVKTGSMEQSFDLAAASTYNPAFVTANGGTVGGAMNAFMNGMDAGKMYFNIHTTSFTGGEIRGFLVAVPEPASAALAGLAAVGLLGRGRRRV